jgi:hypothetical protein
MVKSILQRLVFGTASAALIFTVLKASPTIAAIVSYDFTVDIDYGSLQGNQYNGFFRYQDESIPSNLTGRFFDITAFEFDFVNSAGLPTTYSADDASFPSVYFINGVFEGLSIEAQVNSNVFFEFESEPIVFDEFFYIIYPLPTSQFGGGSVTYNRREEPATSVPEPVASFGLSIFGMSFLLKKCLHKAK